MFVQIQDLDSLELIQGTHMFVIVQDLTLEEVSLVVLLEEVKEQIEQDQRVDSL